ncbi:MAG: hypothetical protein GQ540_11115 [Lutibacter sp.]|uniref:hypothetical protein n=1 Tax=Lutibacter sp. TaxID=1925666 RepID=UPI0019FCE60C|nr:hypothetical protein [Lutibacter sp.]NOR29065.1 hypothetical protein [Lutibacter sp.]
MINVIKQILFRSALVIIVLHTLISHKHYDEMSEVEHVTLHQNNDNILDLLVLFFHESNDESIDNLVVAQFDVKETFKNEIVSNAFISNSDLPFFDTSYLIKELNLSTSNFSNI